MSFVVFCLFLRNGGICREGIKKSVELPNPEIVVVPTTYAIIPLADSTRYTQDLIVFLVYRIFY